MKRALEQLREFHRVFACAMASRPYLPDTETKLLRISLMQEELTETIEAMEAGDLPAIADGLADLCYVAIGTAVAYGLPLDKVFEEVHRANMGKAMICAECSGVGRLYKRLEAHGKRCETCNGSGAVVRYREDGKVLKPEGWKPPDIAAILKE